MIMRCQQHLGQLNKQLFWHVRDAHVSVVPRYPLKFACKPAEIALAVLSFHFALNNNNMQVNIGVLHGCAQDNCLNFNLLCRCVWQWVITKKQSQPLSSLLPTYQKLINQSQLLIRHGVYVTCMWWVWHFAWMIHWCTSEEVWFTKSLILQFNFKSHTGYAAAVQRQSLSPETL